MIKSMLSTIYRHYPWSHYIVISDSEMNEIRRNNAEVELQSLQRKEDLYTEALTQVKEEIKIKEKEISRYSLNESVEDDKVSSES